MPNSAAKPTHFGENGAMQVAVVDYRAPDAPERFTHSLRDTGFAAIVNHPLPAGMVDGIYREWEDFFLSGAARTYPHTEQQDGYFPPEVAETAKGATKRDLKEFFHVYRPWGQYPTEVTAAAREFHAVASGLATELLGWIEAHTPSDVNGRFERPLSRMLDGGHRTLLRILRYPPLTGAEEEGAVRAAAHEDINLITILPGSNQPGLQVLDRAGAWHDAPCDLGMLTINAGDMLKYASGGYYPSTTHRVVNPSGEGAKRSRMSMPLFLHPADDVVLAEGRTAYQFLQERIAILRGQQIS